MERFAVDGEEYWHYLDRMKEQWFFTPAGKGIAAPGTEEGGAGGWLYYRNIIVCVKDNPRYYGISYTGDSLQTSQL